MSVLILIGFIGGLITGISPCILPVLPVIFFAGGANSARSQGPQKMGTGCESSPVFPGVRFTGVNLVGKGAQPISALTAAPTFLSEASHEAAASPGAKQGVSRWRPYLVVAGLVVSFTIFTLLGSTVLTLLGLPQDIIRWLGIVLLLLIGVAMLMPGLMETLERPFAGLGKIRSAGPNNGFFLGLVLGAAYVPCAGPVLAAISVAGSTGTIGADTVALAVSFAAGTAVPLLFFALAGRGLTERIAAFRRREAVIRSIAGVSLIALAVGLVFNVPAHIQRLLPDWTENAQQATNQWLKGGDTDAVACVDGAEALGECHELPELAGISTWLNSQAPITRADLAGSVSLIDFWAYSCVNCQKSLPVIEQLHQVYAQYGLEVVSVHAPEYAFEKEQGNVESAVAEYGLTFPVGIDNDLKAWRAFDNAYWPSLYIADGRGIVRYFKYGEGPKGLLEQHIRTLLREQNPTIELPEPVFSTADDEAAPRTTHTVLGAEGARGFVGGNLSTGAASFEIPAEQPVDSFALAGEWIVKDRVMVAGENARIKIRYFGTHVALVAKGDGAATALRDGQEEKLKLNGGVSVLPLASHEDKAAEGIVELRVPAGVELQELEILGNVCGNGKCGGQGPSWAFGN